PDPQGHPGPRPPLRLHAGTAGEQRALPLPHPLRRRDRRGRGPPAGAHRGGAGASPALPPRGAADASGPRTGRAPPRAGSRDPAAGPPRSAGHAPDRSRRRRGVVSPVDLEALEPLSPELGEDWLEHHAVLPLGFEDGRLRVATWREAPDPQALD